MATDGLPVERLRDYLRQLPTGARGLLVAELERAALRGDDIPGGEVLLQEVRSVVRESGVSVPRAGDPVRQFFKVVQPFLVDDEPVHKSLGRVSRATLEPLWAWISRDLLPAEAQAYRDEIGRALEMGDLACDRLTRDFQRVVADRIQAALAATQTNERLARRTAGQIGTPRALDDARDLVTILQSRDVFDLVESRLPGHIHTFAETQIESVQALLESPICKDRTLLPYMLILVMRRLATPWQLIRLAVKAADSDDAARIAATPFAAAVTIALNEIERMVVTLGADLKRGAAVAIVSLIKCIHDAARGLRTELDLTGESAWGRQLAAIRSEIASLLKTEIESAPGRVRRLLRPRPSNEIGRGSRLDAIEVAETEAVLEVLAACRIYASELAISEMTLRIHHEMQQYLDTGTRALLDALRHAGESDRGFRQSQVDAAVRFCAKIFGQDYASLLTKAAEVAAAGTGERKAAARA